MVARQQNINVRAFRDEAAALRWLSGAVGAGAALPLHAHRDRRRAGRCTASTRYGTAKS